MPELGNEHWTLDTASVLGCGGYATVYSGTFKKEDIAVKVINCKEEQLAVAELSALKRVSEHRNIVRYIARQRTDEEIWIGMELCSNGDLFTRVIDAGHLDESQTRTFFRQMLDAVMHIHSRGVCHRDIKLENLLLTSDDTLKLCDYGMAKIYDDIKRRKRGRCCGSVNYCSPNVINMYYSGSESDAWSCMVCLFVMSQGFFPFDRANSTDWRFNMLTQGGSFTANLFTAYEKERGASDLLYALLDSGFGTGGCPLSPAEMSQNEWVMLSE